MAQRLRQIAADSQPQHHPYISSARLDSARALKLPEVPRERIIFQSSLARESLNVGLIEEAIAGFERVLADMDANPDRELEELRPFVLELLAIAHIWSWKRDNCLEGRRSDLCRMPLEAAGVTRGLGAARAAVAIYATLLRVQPYNLEYRWLVNLASMMAGAYPGNIPTEVLIPPEAFRSEYDVGRFVDVAPALSLDVRGHAGGSIMDDLDNDGYLDILVSSWHLTDPLRFFHNNGDGTFSERTLEAGLSGVTGGLNLIHADYNNDGFLDVLVLRGAWTPYGEPNSLLRNNGDGTFEDVTIEAGLYSVSPTQTASWGDYDNDGWIDLYVGYESRSRNRVFPNQLFRNNRDGTFTDVANETGTAVVGFVKAVTWGDIDNDGRLDLYVSRLRQTNVLLRNLGPQAAGGWQFRDVSELARVTEPNESFPAWFWDYDNDGWLDIFVSGYQASPADVAAEYLGLPHRGESPRLYRNTGGGIYRDVTTQTNLRRPIFAMGANFGDLDNDGFSDLYVGTGDMHFSTLVPNRMLRNESGAFFQDVTASGGFGLLEKGHGIAFGDLDNDGDQELFAQMGGAYEGDVARSVLFENPGHGNHWITLRLEGVRSNRAAIGARIKVSLQTDSGAGEVFATVSSGGSFGANSLQQEIGLGRASAIRTLEITWPATGTTESFTDVAMDRVYRVREGEGVLVPDTTALAFRLQTDRAATAPR